MILPRQAADGRAPSSFVALENCFDRRFWALLIALSATKVALAISDPVLVVYGPHDDSLYASRAQSLLEGGAFGPYTSSTLLKYPGFSLWLALGAFTGAPYLATLNLLHAGGALYLAGALRRAGVAWIAVVAGFLLYLFNPFTFDSGWNRLLREPLATVLLTVIAAALVHVFARLRDPGLPWPHLVVLTVAFGFASHVREEDVLLASIPVAAAVILVLTVSGRRRAVAVACLALPLVASVAGGFAMREWIDARYGARLLHDFGEGEFPRMMAALRSVQSQRDNRYVMLPQESLATVRRTVPEFEPVARRLPRTAPTSVSCEWLGVCTEWANGWFPFWIKDAAFEAGLTPTLPEGQAYFRRVRLAIEAACRDGRIACAPKGDALIPPFDLRWTRALVTEMRRLGKMTLFPFLSERQWPTSIRIPSLQTQFARVTGSPVVAAPETVEESSGLRRSTMWRVAVDYVYSPLAAVVILAACAALAVRIWLSAALPRAALLGAVLAIGAYLMLRFAALSHIAVFVGRYDPRMVMTTHMLLAFLAPAVLALSVRSVQEEAD